MTRDDPRSPQARTDRAETRDRYRDRPGGGVRWSVELTEKQAAALIESAHTANVTPTAHMRDAALRHIGAADLVRPTGMRGAERPNLPSELRVAVVRESAADRWVASLGEGTHTRNLPGSWPSRLEATAAAVAALDEARRAAGLAPYGRTVPVRYPEAGQRVSDCVDVDVARSTLPAPTPGSGRKDRRAAAAAEAAGLRPPKPPR